MCSKERLNPCLSLIALTRWKPAVSYESTVTLFQPELIIKPTILCAEKRATCFYVKEHVHDVPLAYVLQVVVQGDQGQIFSHPPAPLHNRGLILWG